MRVLYALCPVPCGSIESIPASASLHPYSRDLYPLYSLSILREAAERRIAESEREQADAHREGAQSFSGLEGAQSSGGLEGAQSPGGLEQTAASMAVQQKSSRREKEGEHNQRLEMQERQKATEGRRQRGRKGPQNDLEWEHDSVFDAIMKLASEAEAKANQDEHKEWETLSKRQKQKRLNMMKNHLANLENKSQGRPATAAEQAQQPP